MSKLLSRPSQEQPVDVQGRFERFNLTENPFPSEPAINKESGDKRINGNIYEAEIRRKEYDQIVQTFLMQPQSNPNHHRLGYIIDTSYIGRGNGKSAFLVNLQQDINREFCLNLSNNANKCFALYVTPEPGGRTKSFTSFVDLLFQSILSMGILKDCLAALRLDAIVALHPKAELQTDAKNESALVNQLNSPDWFRRRKFDLQSINEHIFKNKFLQDLPNDFPLFKGRNSFLPDFITEADFAEHYLGLKKGRARFDFIFSSLVRLFQAAGFNGGYILVDDFERIPDFQSARQKKDFALELRSCLFDGLYVSARTGFYNILLVLHAGVPGLIRDAWAESGMENRAPISPQTAAKHVIRFEKLSKEHAVSLLRKYLAEYRINKKTKADLFPFTEGAVSKIGEMTEYNAAKILKTAYDLLDKASEIDGQKQIDEKFVSENRSTQDDATGASIPAIEDAESIDLVKKAGGQD